MISDLQTTSQTGIQEGTRVILQKGEDYKSVIVAQDRVIRFGKVRFKLNGIIGKEFGTQLLIEDEKLIPIVVPVPSTTSQDVQSMDVQGCSSDRSNKDLVESDGNQKIKQEEILKMRESGISGEAIVDKLIENSQTFQNKTEFSQEKYIKKKKKKHVAVVRVLRPTTRLVFEMFHKRAPGDVGYMRVDTFSQIMAFANIIPGSHIGIIDTYKGLLVAATLDQLGGTGAVIQLIPDNIFLKDSLKYYNITDETLESYCHYNIENLGTLQADYNKEESMVMDQSGMASSSSVPSASSAMDFESSGSLVIDDNQSAIGSDTLISESTEDIQSESSANTLISESTEDIQSERTAKKLKLKSTGDVQSEDSATILKSESTGDIQSEDSTNILISESTETIDDNQSSNSANTLISESTRDNQSANGSHTLISESTETIDDSQSESESEEENDENQSANGDNTMKSESTESTESTKSRTSNRKRKREAKKNKTPEELEACRQARLRNSAKRKKAQKILIEKSLDALIISSKFHPTPLLMRMLEFINPSRPVVVYSHHIEPLLDCYMKVKGSGKGVNLQVTETWYREYQVLPQRTHPAVKMSGTGGYLLTFTSVAT